MNIGLMRSELRFLHRNLRHYLSYWPTDQADWRPAPGSFTLLELACHLYTLPRAYALILKGASDDEVVRVTGGPWVERTPAELATSLEAGIRELEETLESLTDEQLASKLFAWPFGDPLSAEHHLLNLITHLYHHRGQFHLYLKQLGAPVDTGTIYTA